MTIKEMKKKHIIKVLNKTNGNIKESLSLLYKDKAPSQTALRTTIRNNNINLIEFKNYNHGSR